jgi:hypothetical protein
MLRLLPLILLAAACNSSAPGTVQLDKLEVPSSNKMIVGRIESEQLLEVSGLTSSQRDPGLLWLHNDGGSPATIHAIDYVGATRGELMLDGANNIDWEDMAGFSRDGRSYLLIADIGDNNSKRDFVSLYVVDEPDLHETAVQNLPASARIDFRYPDGPHDAESIAVDVEGNRVLVMSKRDIPTTLYELPLDATKDQHADEVQIAKRLGRVASLPLPTEKDIKRAPLANYWHWQPTAMDISPDASAIAILTYRAVYHFTRVDNEDWARTLRRAPQVFDLGNVLEAEAIAYSADSRSLFVTAEGRNPPLLRIELQAEPQP